MNIQWAAAMGFNRNEAQRSMTMVNAAAMPYEFGLAMDVARFLCVSLDEATSAVILGPSRLSRLGFRGQRDTLPDEARDRVRGEVVGQAEAYTHTIYGSMAVREAEGHTFSRVFTDLLERWFGSRSDR